MLAKNLPNRVAHNSPNKIPVAIGLWYSEYGQVLDPVHYKSATLKLGRLNSRLAGISVGCVIAS